VIDCGLTEGRILSLDSRLIEYDPKRGQLSLSFRVIVCGQNISRDIELG
jgi:hypothetical protein